MNTNAPRLRTRRDAAAVAALIGLSFIANAHAKEVTATPFDAASETPAAAPDRLLVRLTSGATATAKSAAAKGAVPALPFVQTLTPLMPQTGRAAKGAGAPEWFLAELQAGADRDAAMAELSALEGVLGVELDFELELPEPLVGEIFEAADSTAALATLQYGLSRIAAIQAWSVNHGDLDVVVAVVDTGVQLDHPDLVHQIWRNPYELPNGKDDDGNGFVDDLYGWNFHWHNNNPDDTGGHGTHVAGVIAATQDNGLGIDGAANVSIMPVKVLGRRRGWTSNIMAGVRYAVENGASVINMSLGGTKYSKAFADLCEHAMHNGVVIVAAAGNQASDKPSYPSGYPGVISVGAVDVEDLMAPFSNYGGSQFVVAPGVDILSTYNQSRYAVLSGTSMASPHVAGVAALLLSYDPSMTAEDVRRRLAGTSDDIGDVGWDPNFGNGRVNAYRALTETVKAIEQADDQYEPNDDIQLAISLPPGTYSLEGLDLDWFKLELGRGSITVRIDGPEGDLDLYLGDAEGNVIDASNGFGSIETVIAELGDGPYYLVVAPYEGQTGAYTLVIEFDPVRTLMDNACGAGAGMSMSASLLGLAGLGFMGRRRGRGPLAEGRRDNGT